MTCIKISEIRPTGSELFQDSESYLNALNEQEISVTIGGHKNDVPVHPTNNVTTIDSISCVTGSCSPQLKLTKLVFGRPKH
jgi:hypothetical protein